MVYSVKTVPYFVLAVLLTVSGTCLAMGGHGQEVPVTRDLAAEAEQARDRQMPLLLMFAAEDCDYCRLLEAEILNPMVISGEYDHKVLIRRVMTDDFGRVRDFEGKLVDSDELASRYNVQVTPTVVLVDYQGRELAPRVVGTNTIEMYSAYLDRAIDVSRDLLRR